MLYGHRRDVHGDTDALEYFDSKLPEIMSKLDNDDILIITTDQGCDPTAHGTDHTREFVPIIVWGPHIKEGVNLHIRETFADIAAIIIEKLEIGFDVVTSFLKEVEK